MCVCLLGFSYTNRARHPHAHTHVCLGVLVFVRSECGGGGCLSGICVCVIVAGDMHMFNLREETSLKVMASTFCWGGRLSSEPH